MYTYIIEASVRVDNDKKNGFGLRALRAWQ